MAFKCENHKLDLICRGCVRAWMNRHNALLDFVKKASCFDMPDDPRLLAKEALILLKKIGVE